MRKLTSILVWPIMLAPVVYLAIVWNSLPAEVALHFNIKGEPDRFGSKRELLVVIVLVTLLNIGVYLLLKNIHRIDPKRYGSGIQPRMKTIAFVSALLLSVVFCMIVYSSVAGHLKMDNGLVFAGIGILYAIFGNYMPNLKPNYFAGIRVPWTLENEENWRKTHFLAGKLWVAGGVLVVIACPFLPTQVSFIFFITVTAIIAIIPCIYSYRLFRKQNLINREKQ